MARVEIEESDLLAGQNVVRAVNQILSNPDARKMLLQARKMADPTAVIPELEMTTSVASEREEIRKMLEADKAERAAERARQETEKLTAAFTKTWEGQKEALRNAGWRNEGLAAVEKFAQEHGIGDLQIAADAWEKRNPPQEPAQPNGFGSWGFFEQPKEDDTFVKSMIETRGENEGALDAEIRAALSEFRGQPGIRR